MDKDTLRQTPPHGDAKGTRWQVKWEHNGLVHQANCSSRLAAGMVARGLKDEFGGVQVYELAPM